MKNKILTVAHTKGGVGKSTILNQVVIFLLSLGHKIRVADCDPNKVTTFISKRRSRNSKLKNFDSTVISSLQELESFCAIPYDGITIIDTAGVDCILTRKAIELGTVTVVPVAPVTTELIGFGTFKAIVSKLNVKNSSIKVVLNQVHVRAKDFAFFKDAAKSPFDYFDTALPRLSDFDNSLASGNGVTELPKIKDPKTKELKEKTSSLRIKSLTNEILISLKQGA
ncbi:MAG: chromosome partitioning protein [Arcobacteraceae bacterium]|jgi:chromosome partitioning protein